MEEVSRKPGGPSVSNENKQKMYLLPNSIKCYPLKLIMYLRFDTLSPLYHSDDRLVNALQLQNSTKISH